jgi:putative addiction module component (TIGR02574 family)
LPRGESLRAAAREEGLRQRAAKAGILLSSHRPPRSATLAKETDRSGEIAMPVSIEALGIHQLSVAERLELIEQIWNSLPEQVSPQNVPEWHLAELTKRRAQAATQPGLGKPWREVLGPLEGTS